MSVNPQFIERKRINILGHNVLAITAFRAMIIIHYSERMNASFDKGPTVNVTFICESIQDRWFHFDATDAKFIPASIHSMWAFYTNTILGFSYALLDTCNFPWVFWLELTYYFSHQNRSSIVWPIYYQTGKINFKTFHRLLSFLSIQKLCCGKTVFNRFIHIQINSEDLPQYFTLSYCGSFDFLGKFSISSSLRLD